MAGLSNKKGTGNSAKTTSRKTLLRRSIAFSATALVVWALYTAGILNQDFSAPVVPANRNAELGLLSVKGQISAKLSAEAAANRKPAKKQRVLIKPAPPLGRRTKTDAGVDVSDPALYTGVDLKGDSSTATVMGMASGYDLDVYQRFVGSLRKSGFKGHIFLGVAPDVDSRVLEYFKYRNVVPKIQKWVNCTYTKDESKKNDIFKKTQCAHPYPDIKIRWSRFPLQRDWLEACQTCTGPVLVLDVRDSWFQQDPFGPGSPVIKGLHVYEEHKSQTTQHWLTNWPIGDCKGVTYNETMLCSGTTVGTRVAMLKYLEVMYAEMKAWITDPSCRFDINGDDQSIHNHLYYSGQLPFAKSWANRAGGLVNTVGVEGANIWKAHGKGTPSYPGAQGSQWIGPEFNLVDRQGFFTEADGTRSRVIHQWDRFGKHYLDWLMKQDLIKDALPEKSNQAT